MAANASWIWIDGTWPGNNVFALFRRRFSGGAGTRIRVSVCGNYAAFVNGKIAAFGQYTDFPDSRTYTETDVSRLCSGDDELVVSVHYSGNGFTSHTDGEPGIWAEIEVGGEVVAATDSSWEAMPDLRYAFGNRPVISGSLDYTFEFDATRSPAPWSPAVVLPRRDVAPTPRPVAPCEDVGYVSGEVVRSGRLLRNGQLPLGSRFAADILDPSDGANGIYALFDLGEERTGLLQIEVEADDGTVFEIAHGEYVADGRIPPAVVGPNDRTASVDRYIAHAGRQAFVHHLRRLGCRYLEIHAMGDPSTTRILSAGLRVVELPGMATPPFECSDQFFVKAHGISARTLRLCLHEKFENCPWREQSICAYDARNQQLFGYLLWGNYEKAAAMIRLFAQAQRGNGFLLAATPFAGKLWIPMFTFSWMASIYEYELHSGDASLFDEFRPLVADMLSKILAHKCGDLYAPPDDEGIWNYCESSAMEYCANPPNAFYNLYLREALMRIATLLDWRGCDAEAAPFRAEAERIGRIAEARFFDPSRGGYLDSLADANDASAQLFGHVQSLFLAHGLVPPDRVRGVIDGIRSGAFRFQSLASLPYLIRGFMRCGARDDMEWLHAKMKSLYGAMVEAGDTTWWEDALGRGYAAGRGSLCHGWSAAIALYTARVILGIEPLEPGFRRYRCEPMALGGMTSASGSVMTPHGPINVSWRLGSDGVEADVHAPDRCDGGDMLHYSRRTSHGLDIP